jgi:hypothetical protein
VYLKEGELAVLAAVVVGIVNDVWRSSKSHKIPLRFVSSFCRVR